MPTIFSRHRTLGVMLSLCVVLLSACGGSDGSSSIRLLNATVDVGSLNLFTGDDKRAGDVAADTVSGYADLKDGSHELKLKRSGSDTTLLSNSINLTKDKHYTVIGWGRDDSMRLTMLADDEDEPSSGIAKIRVFNSATDAGSVDMYITDASVSLDSASANAQSVATGALSGYAEVGKGSYRLRITGAGDKTDLRLDVPAITLRDKDLVTVVLQPTPGGVLAHALVVVQRGAVSIQKNTNARARVVASVSGNGVVSAKVDATPLSAALTSPGVGSYVLVPAGSRTLLAQVNGATVSSATTSFTAGADYTVMVYGSTTLAQLMMVFDNNRLPTSSGKAKMRLVHGVEGYETLSLSLDSVSVANELWFGDASSFVQVSTNNGNALIEVTSALSATPLYTTTKTSGTTGVSIENQGVYTMFMLGGNSKPRGVMRKER